MTDERTAEQKISSQAQQIALDVRNALTAVEMNKAKIEATSKARELAERKFANQHEKLLAWCRLTARDTAWAVAAKNSEEYQRGFRAAKTDLARKKK